MDVSLTHHCVSPCLSPSLPLSLKMNLKNLKIFKNNNGVHEDSTSLFIKCFGVHYSFNYTTTLDLLLLDLIVLMVQIKKVEL